MAFLQGEYKFASKTKNMVQMKRLVTLSIILSSTFCAYAQDVEKTITLDEVTVKAAKVVNKADGMII